MTAAPSSVIVCDNDMQPEPDSPIHAKLAFLRRLKEISRELAERADTAKAEMERYQAILFQEMRDERVTSLKHEGKSYAAKETIYATVQDLDAFAEWARENGLETEFLKEAAVKRLLNELVNARLNSQEELPPGLGWYAKQYISIT